MKDVLSFFFSDLSTLTPATIVEMFSMFCFFELIGMLFDWIKGARY